MSQTPPSRNEPKPAALRGNKSRNDNAPIGVDAETVQQDLARYGALIANAKNVVNQNINAPITVSRFGFVNALLRVITRYYALLFRRGD